MSPPNTPAAAAVDAALPEIATLEQKLGMLIAQVKVLRAMNDNLRRDLAAAEDRNQALSERVAEAKRRLDSLVARLPEPTE
jgi:chromosome segregation ATPase